MAADEPTELEGIPLDRREFVQRLLRGSAFAVPVALGLSTVALRDAQAQAAGSASSSAASSSGGGLQSSAATPGGGLPSSAAAVPEPATLALLGLGAAGAALAARRRGPGDDSDTA